MFSDLEAGLDRIQAEDRLSQENFLKVFISDRYLSFVEEVEGEDINFSLNKKFGKDIGMIVNYLLDLKCFFVPNNDYMVRYFGNVCVEPSSGCYDYEGNCLWLGKLVFPIRGAVGVLEGFTAYNPFSRAVKEENELSGENEPVPPKYTISSKKIFDRDSHLFIPNGYRKMIEDGYVIIVDGVFDAAYVGMLGYNSACNLGTYINEKVLFPLSLNSKVFVAHDNDRAGLLLLREIRKAIPKALSISQGVTKDIDDYFKVRGFNDFKSKVDTAVKSKFLDDIAL